ncbi:hypothetical protein Syun_005837 [Stephania yunnanensis]|uniref:Uncharacterized protein n=1 Tax=Stephania yunnanensis TaxID=152371 RepID=A0AAP0KVU6_9MAGN
MERFTIDERSPNSINSTNLETLKFNRSKKKKNAKKNRKNQVFLEGYVVESMDDDDHQERSSSSSSKGFSRTVSLTDEDLEELKGCVDLGFGFSYEEIPELCNTLPALELCYSMSQKFLDEQQQRSPESSVAAAPALAAAEGVLPGRSRIGRFRALAIIQKM